MQFGPALGLLHEAKYGCVEHSINYIKTRFASKSENNENKRLRRVWRYTLDNDNEILIDLDYLSRYCICMHL